MMKFASGEEAVRVSSEMRLATDPKISDTLSHVPGDRTQTSVNTDKPSYSYTSYTYCIITSSPIYAQGRMSAVNFYQLRFLFSEKNLMPAL